MRLRRLFTLRAGWDHVLIASSYLYLVIPILIFFFGWLKLPLALIAAVVLLIGTFLVLRDFGYIQDYGFISLEFIVFSLLIVSAWVVFSGIGGFGLQNIDFLYRNAVLRDLIEHRWPVIYDYSSDAVMKGIFGNTGALVYYFHYWLPSALVGKVLGWKAANLALFLWTLAGIFLCILLMTRYIGRGRVLVVLAFVFWSGLDILGKIIVYWPAYVGAARVAGTLQITRLLGVLLALVLSNPHLEAWVTAFVPIYLIYDSFTTQLFWVFNSSIPAWLVTLLFLNLKAQKSVLFTFFLIFFFSPLSGLGLVPYLVYGFLDRAWSLPLEGAREAAGVVKESVHRYWALLRARLLQYLTFQNTAAVLAMALVMGAFYGAQVGHQPQGFVWDRASIDLQDILYYLGFILLEVGVFGLFVFHGRENRTLLIVTLVWLAVIPLYHYGNSNDFMLKGAMPPLVILFTAGFKNILSKFEGPLGTRRRISRMLLVLVLLIGAVTPLHEFFRSRDAIVRKNGFPGYYDPAVTFGTSEAADPSTYAVKLHDIRNFVVGDPESTWFFGALARR